MKRQKGFSLIEGLLIVLAISVIGFGGWYVWSQQDEEDSTTETAQQESQNNQDTNEENGGGEQPAVRVSYTTWTEADKEFEDDNVKSLYSSNSGTASLRVYGENNPRIYYSSNAPVYCEYESDSWQHYAAFNSNNEYVKDDSSDACTKIEINNENGLTIYSRYGGALGQVRYIAALQVNGEWFVISDNENYDADREVNGEITDAEYEEINQRLKNTVDQRIAETFISS